MEGASLPAALALRKIDPVARVIRRLRGKGKGWVGRAAPLPLPPERSEGENPARIGVRGLVKRRRWD
ncbi:hypothetical protein GCM10007285_19240 [Stappia taiwanensis]|nr:hypothetical protein GCM10007285_19240 [Stappia taiwanensis]